MSFVIAAPEVMAAAATDLANIGSSISAASAAAAGPTMGILAAGADEVSVAISALFGSHAQGYQTLSAQLAAYHNQFVRALNAGAGSYASAEAAKRAADPAQRDQRAHPNVAGAPVDRQRRRRGSRAKRWARRLVVRQRW